MKRILTVSMGIMLLLVFLAYEVSTTYEMTPELEQEAVEITLAAGKPLPPQQFTQDGCTFFPNTLLWHDLRPACLAHDIAYWAGGTNEERKAADLALKEQISSTGPLGKSLGWLMYYPVRIFGDTWLTRIRNAHWGYGWDE